MSESVFLASIKLFNLTIFDYETNQIQFYSDVLNIINTENNVFSNNPSRILIGIVSIICAIFIFIEILCKCQYQTSFE